MTGCEVMKCEYFRCGTGGTYCAYPGAICRYRHENDNAEIARLQAEVERLDSQISDLLMRLKDEWGKKEYEKLQIRCDAAEKRVRDFMCSIEGGWYARYMAQDAEYEKLKEELRQVRVARDAHRDISFYKEEELAAARKELDEARELADRFRDASDIFAEYNIQLKQDLTTCRKELDAERGKVERLEKAVEKYQPRDGCKCDSCYFARLLKQILTGEGS